MYTLSSAVHVFVFALRFLEACSRVKSAPLRDLRQELTQVYLQFLSASAPEPINVDSQIAENVRRRLQAPPANSPAAAAAASASSASPSASASASAAVSSERYTFEDARVCIYTLQSTLCSILYSRIGYTTVL